MNVCAETYPLSSESHSGLNPFVGMDDETEYYDPYVFPAIVEKESETEQTSSFSVWQTDKTLKEEETSSEAVNSEESADSPSLHSKANLLNTQTNSATMERLVAAIAEAIQTKMGSNLVNPSENHFILGNIVYPKIFSFNLWKFNVYPIINFFKGGGA